MWGEVHPRSACVRSPAATSTTTGSRPRPPTRSPGSRTSPPRSSWRAGGCSRTIARTARSWWVCSRILAARRRGGAAAHSRCASSKADRTGDRLGATLPLLDEDEVVAVVGYSRTIDDALRRAIRPRRRRRAGRRRRSRRRASPPAQRSRGAGRRLVGPGARAHRAAARSRRAAIGPGACARAGRRRRGSRPRSARAPGKCGWSAASAGCCRPGCTTWSCRRWRPNRMFEEISLQRFDRIAGPRGLERPADATARIDCPVVPELLRPLA